MKPHVHLGITEIATFVAMLAVVGYLWRSTSAVLVSNDNPTLAEVGKAMAFIY